jgi:hypothetical protein
MRRFHSYGPIDTEEHYYAPRKGLIEKAYTQLVGHNPKKSGHYITVWAPRQCGKTWIMQEVIEKITQSTPYTCGIFTLERGKKAKNEKDILEVFTNKLSEVFQVKFPSIKKFREIPSLFTRSYFQEPVILIIDEFDALKEEFINDFAGVFRDIFITRTNESDRESKDKTYLLHGLALVGVRSVLGIENETGSPFNVQRNLHIPNLLADEVKEMFQWYEKESGQKVEAGVVDRLYNETRGQPGLTCWLGELLTEGWGEYRPEKGRPITRQVFEKVYAAAIFDLPSNNILNIISKARKEPHKQLVLELFRTDRKLDFSFDHEETNFLYMHGVVDKEMADVNDTKRYIRFASPLVQKRLFNYFSGLLSRHVGRLYDPMLDLDIIITRDSIDIKKLLGLYQQYLKNNSQWLFKDAPRRDDLKIREAVFHFNLFSYLNEFLKDFDGSVLPEFPTGNGKVDLLIRYQVKLYALEVKSFSNIRLYREALDQAARYAKSLGLADISLVFFIEMLDKKNREKYQAVYKDDSTGVTVTPIFIETAG